jgi:DNA-binding transcriptional MerR regulator
MQYFNIQIASQLSGVASATIRAWEKRYQAVHPERADNKHRLYSEKDIEKLAILYRLTEIGQSIGKIAHLDLPELKQIYTTLLHKPYEEREVVASLFSTVNIDDVLRNFHLAIASYKLDILSHEFEKTKDMLSPRDLCLNILVPLFHEIGIRVGRGEFSIAQEHAVSALASFYLGQVIAKHYQKTNQDGDLVLITTPEGDMHQIGILGAALLCVHYGHRFIYLGPSLPAASLGEMANALNAKAILLGSLSAQDSLSEYLQKLEENLIKKTSLWIGGNIKVSPKAESMGKNIMIFNSLHAFDEFIQKF